jgi:hypothetical protein
MTTDDVDRWQRDAKAAFGWLATMYEQTQTLVDDARHRFEERGWRPNAEGGFGGNAMAWADLADWPFCYLTAIVAVRSERGEGHSGTLPIFGVLFYDEQRTGPAVYAGTFRCTKKPTAGMWAAYGALTGHKGRFARDGGLDAGVRRATPTAAGRKRFPWLAEARWYEAPLGSISSASVLTALVDAAIAMAEGDDAGALKLVAAMAAQPSAGQPAT